MRLSSLDQVPVALRPGYDPAAHAVGIVHLGLGAFHKAHQAALTDLALAASGGDWRILGVSLRSARAVDEIAPQNGLYTLIEGERPRVVAAIAGALCAAGNPAPVLAAMTRARIVSLTVTEKAYGLDRGALDCDPLHPAVAADLAQPRAPQGVLGLLTEALRLCRAANRPPFTVLCCDNLPENGKLLRAAVTGFARCIDPDLADWIADRVAFPSTMVDRITPAPTEATRAAASAALGVEDQAAVETEPFCQWVIEDHFPQGRPAWPATFVSDVAPHEAMKLRMLNGSHSMLAYAGFHAGMALVRDVMADPDLRRLVVRHMKAAQATLNLPDLDAYAAALLARFANPAIAHATFQIAMDGSEKMPQRIFAAVPLAQDLRPFAFATAAWLRHLSLSTHDCPPYELRDPRPLAAPGLDAAGIFAKVDALVPIPPALRPLTLEILTQMLSRPMRDVIAAEALR